MLVAVMQSKRFNVMNVKGFTEIGFAQPATLAGSGVTLIGAATLRGPICPVVLRPAAAPRSTVFARHVFGLPLPHTRARAKVMLLKFCVFAFKCLAALGAIDFFTSPTKQNGLTFQTASHFGVFIEAVQSGVKRLAAYGARRHVALCRLVMSGTDTVAKPQPGSVVFHAAWLPFDCLLALRTVNYHA